MTNPLLVAVLVRLVLYPAVFIVAGLWWTPKSTALHGMFAGLTRVALGVVLGIPVGLALAGALSGVAFGAVYWAFRFALWAVVGWAFYRDVPWRQRLVAAAAGLAVNLAQDLLLEGLQSTHRLFSIHFC